ncbi:unnamed protein product (macronuclear) [Paramecium tetraurelia]|uniref:Uncharacterized protein n=1 Tax=Paramecium tetraurelia TaxID=5888 RepID=A0CRG7_PARTE|nr:uncharacterized protein GSPATT00009699001 [Paramecium tetraurelia]CAK73384.1 unnamed protein product [Paramecium tetraurelia]|eukprot:XP_001440781.1 hypothetical protein (macronuclear) [Paramecium tetraurelia strain d4-2]
MNDKSNFESQSADQLMVQMTQNFMEFKNYKSQLIKEANSNSGDQAFNSKCFELFQKCFYKKTIVLEMLDYKKLNKIALNETENHLFVQQLLTIAYNQESKHVDQLNKKKVDDYFKQLSLISPQQAIDKMQKDLVQQQDTYLKELLKRNLQKFKEEQDKYINKPQQQVSQGKQSILQTAVVAKKLQQLRNQYKEFQVEDQQVLAFLSDQFSFYMKNLLGKVIQSVLIQKPGYEFKLYQNKGASAIDTQSVKYKQQMEMQKKYGPQKNQFIDQSLLVGTENKLSLTYELCDYTPIQRQVEFRNFLSEIEPHQEDKLKNKIRKNKWKEEHPELEEILKKRIKRGAELWNQVQDFLCKRENNDYIGDSEEESDKVKEQQQQLTDNIDDDQLDLKIQDIQRNSERLLIAGKTHIKTRLNNMESDNPLLTQKVITVKTVQFVLEQHPYFSRSRILYKSYIL